MVASFLLAVQFLTRVPTPKLRTADETRLRWSTAFFPLIGALVGLAAAGLYQLLAGALPPQAAVLCALGLTVLLTGGLHEDGLADCADALGSGGTRRRMLEIMHDSRIGTFGALALIGSFLLRFTLLAALPGPRLVAAMITAHSAGRGLPLILVRLFPLARQSGLAASFARQVGALQIALGLATIGLVLWLTGLLGESYLLVPAAVAAGIFALYCRIRLGGLTGDVLGAGIQIFEIVFYASLAWKI